MERTDDVSILERLLPYRETILLICLGFARNRWDAEELAQDTYLRALRRPPAELDDTVLRAWLCRVARNTCIDYLRRAQRRALHAALAAMPLRFREVRLGCRGERQGTDGRDRTLVLRRAGVAEAATRLTQALAGARWRRPIAAVWTPSCAHGGTLLRGAHGRVVHFRTGGAR